MRTVYTETSRESRKKGEKKQKACFSGPIGHLFQRTRIHRSVCWGALMRAKFTPQTLSTHYWLALPPSCVGHRAAYSLVLCPGRQLFCLKLTKTHTQRYKRRNGGYEEAIRQPWNRPGLTGMKATCPACKITTEVASKYPRREWLVNDNPPKLFQTHGNKLPRLWETSAGSPQSGCSKLQ